MKKFENQIRGIKIIVIFFFIQFLAGFTYEIYAAFAEADGSVISEALAEARMMEFLSVFEFIFIILLVRRYRVSIVSTIKDARENYKHFFKMLGIYLVFYYSFLWLASFIDGQFFAQFAESIGENQATLEGAMDAKPSIFVIASICVLGPIIEEYVFRYAIMNKLLAGTNRYVAAVIATIIFAFVHIGFAQMFSLEIGHTIHLYLMYLPVSIVLSFIYAREDNLLYPVIFHIFSNSLSVGMSMLAFVILF